MTASPRDPMAGRVSTAGGMADPPPKHPHKPLPFDCCESGCDRCVFDIYDEELAAYQSAVAAWRARHPGLDPDGVELSGHGESSLP